MTVRETVMRETPARKAAASTMANIRGEMSGIAWPTRRPKRAPASRAGMMIPEGNFATQSYDCEDELDGSPVEEPAVVAALVFLRFLVADPGPFWVSAVD
jgi:hypothetical protein